MARHRTSPIKIVAVLSGVTALAVAAIVIIGQLRSPLQPEGTPTTPPGSTTSIPSAPPSTIPPTTTTLPGQIVAMGQPFPWASSLEVADQIALTLLEHEESVFLFTTTPSLDPDFSSPTGLQTWASSDGTNWELRSVIADEFEVFDVISSRFGLIAAGLQPETGDGLIWRSTDGSEWSTTVVSTGEAPTSKGHIRFAAATDDLAYVSVARYQEVDSSRIGEALSDHFGVPITNFDLTASADDEPPNLVVYGPFGVWLGTVSHEEAGLTRSDVEYSDDLPVWVIWVSRDGVTWTEHSDDAPVTSPFVGLDGRLWAQGAASGSGPATVALSPDTLVWEEAAPPSRAEVAHQWSNGYIGWSEQHSLHRVSISPDGQSWLALNLMWLLPRELAWAFYAIGGSERGAAAIGTTFESPLFEVAPIEWEQDGYQIVALPYHFEIVADGTHFTVPRWTWYDDPVNVRWDSARGTLEVFDPRAGESVFFLDIDEMSRHLPEGDRRPSGGGWGTMIGQAFLFSYAETWQPPGVIHWNSKVESWTVQDIGSLAAERATHVLVTTDRVILVTSAEPGIEVFTSPIPRGPQ